MTAPGAHIFNTNLHKTPSIAKGSRVRWCNQLYVNSILPAR